MKTTIIFMLVLFIGLASPQLHAAQVSRAIQKAPSQVMQTPVTISPLVKSPKLYYVAKDMQVYCTKGSTGQILCLADYHNFPKCNNDIDRPVAFSRYTDQEMDNRAIENDVATAEFVDIIGYDMSLQYSPKPVSLRFTFSPEEKAKWQSYSNDWKNYELRAIRAIRACMNFSDFLMD